jgi:hypothetical protein
MTEPLDEVLTFAERAYVRMQAEQLIRQCLDRGDSSAFNALLENLVLAGAGSLGVLREIQDELQAARTHLGREGLNVRQDLVQALSEFGVQLPQLLSAEAPDAFRQICRQGLSHDAARAASHRLEAEDERLLQEICSEAGNRVTGIARRLALLKRMQRLVGDWQEGLLFEALQARETVVNPRRPSTPQ